MLMLQVCGPHLEEIGPGMPSEFSALPLVRPGEVPFWQKSDPRVLQLRALPLSPTQAHLEISLSFNDWTQWAWRALCTLTVVRAPRGSPQIHSSPAFWWESRLVREQGLLHFIPTVSPPQGT